MSLGPSSKQQLDRNLYKSRHNIKEIMYEKICWEKQVSLRSLFLKKKKKKKKKKLILSEHFLQLINIISPFSHILKFDTVLSIF